MTLSIITYITYNTYNIAMESKTPQLSEVIQQNVKQYQSEE